MYFKLTTWVKKWILEQLPLLKIPFVRLVVAESNQEPSNRNQNIWKTKTLIYKVITKFRNISKKFWGGFLNLQNSPEILRNFGSHKNRIFIAKIFGFFVCKILPVIKESVGEYRRKLQRPVYYGWLYFAKKHKILRIFLQTPTCNWGICGWV